MAKPLVDSAAIRSFFTWSDRLDYDILRPLSYVRANWELWWDATSQCYETEDDSYAADLNDLIDEFAPLPPVAFVDKLPAPRPTVRIVCSDADAAALDAEDKREAEIDALPKPDRALKRLDQRLDHLIATLTTLKTKLQTFRKQDAPDTPADVNENQ